MSSPKEISILFIVLLTFLVAHADAEFEVLETAANESAERPSDMAPVNGKASDLVARTQQKQEQRETIRVFRGKARGLLQTYYDFRLGLRDEPPEPSGLRALLRDLSADLKDTFVHADIKQFVLGKLDEAQALENESRLRQAVNELAFFLKDLPALDVENFAGEPRMIVSVDEPWRKVKPNELVLPCNTQELLSALNSDSTPDYSQSGLEVYRQLGDASRLIIEDILPDNEGKTEAAMVRIEQETELNVEDGRIAVHPVAVFRTKKAFLDKYDRDEQGQPKLKSFEFDLRQVVKTTRDAEGNITEHIVTNELVDPVLVGGTKKLGQYGLHYYKTVLKAVPVDGDEDSTLVRFSVLSVPDYHGRLSTSRMRLAVSVFINMENRKVKSRTLMRVKEHWPKRVALDESETSLVSAPAKEAPGRNAPGHSIED